MQILETDRIVLRRLTPVDLHDLFALYSDPDVRRYFPEGTLTLEQTKDELDWFATGDPAHPTLGLWATILKETGELIGRCGLLPWTIDGREEVEVAYMISRARWGNGYGTEAARGLVHHGFVTLGLLPRLICLIDRENEASKRVAVKIGMSFDKEGYDDKGPFQLYSLERPR